MKSTRAILTVSVAVLLLLKLSGIVSAQEGVGGVPAPAGGEVAAVVPHAETAPQLSPLGQVERRLMVYEDRLTHWRELAGKTSSPALLSRRPPEWDGCYGALVALADGYGRLLEQVAHHHEVGAEPWQVMGEDIAFLEGECPKVYQRAVDLVAGGVEVTPPDMSQGAPAGAAPAPPVAEEAVPQLGEQELLQAWNRAAGLFDAGKYEEAIPQLSGLLKTSYGAAAKDMLLKAQTEIAKQLRSQAAAIFVKARKTEAPEQKGKMLEESWTLLNKIVTSYPEIAIIDKVKQNLTQVEEQLDEINPTLLQGLKNPAGEKG